ncbi:MAG: hypothetical protein WBB89_03015 [Candidatus Acidiferrum sp.]
MNTFCQRSQRQFTITAGLGRTDILVRPALYLVAFIYDFQGGKKCVA